MTHSVFGVVGVAPAGHGAGGGGQADSQATQGKSFRLAVPG